VERRDSMIKIIRKTKSPVEVFVTEKEFKEMLSKKEFRIIALKNNELSQKFFKDKDSKFMIFNIKFGIERASYANSLVKEDLVDEIIIIK